jgi:hypothetical protein
MDGAVVSFEGDVDAPDHLGGLNVRSLRVEEDDAPDRAVLLPVYVRAEIGRVVTRQPSVVRWARQSRFSSEIFSRFRKAAA